MRARRPAGTGVQGRALVPGPPGDHAGRVGVHADRRRRRHGRRAPAGRLGPRVRERRPHGRMRVLPGHGADQLGVPRRHRQTRSGEPGRRPLAGRRRLRLPDASDAGLLLALELGRGGPDRHRRRRRRLPGRAPGVERDPPRPDRRPGRDGHAAGRLERAPRSGQSGPDRHERHEQDVQGAGQRPQRHRLGPVAQRLRRSDHDRPLGPQHSTSGACLENTSAPAPKRENPSAPTTTYPLRVCP